MINVSKPILHTNTYRHTLYTIFHIIIGNSIERSGFKPSSTTKWTWDIGNFPVSEPIKCDQIFKTKKNVFQVSKHNHWLIVCYTKCQLLNKPCHSDDIIIVFVSKMHKAKILICRNIFRDPSSTKAVASFLFVLTQGYVSIEGNERGRKRGRERGGDQLLPTDTPNRDQTCNLGMYPNL